jgi:hypothetical protein
MNEVERVYEDLVGIQRIVDASNNPSAKTAFAEHSAKTLLTAGASYFERRIMGAIQVYVEASTTKAAVGFFAFQGLERKFFSLFDFTSSAKNVNVFLAKFGPDFANWAKVDLLKSGIDEEVQFAFVDFCRLRNLLIHSNYATFNINKTFAEVKLAFDAASKFVSWVETAFDRFEKSRQAP